MEVLTFGESVVVFNPDSRGPLRYVEGYKKSLGGAESNFATALARLGHSVGWFSRLGKDEFGRFILNTIRAEGVDVSKIVFDDERTTGILFKERYQSENPNVYYYRKNSAASALNVNDLNEEYIKSAKILHLTGITPALSRSSKEAVFKAIKIAKESGVIVSFDPNVRLKLWSLEEAKPVLLELLSMADIVMPGIDEAKMLIGESDPKKISQYFLNRGSSMVAVKLGAKGCYLRNKSEDVFVNGYKVDHVVDTVGAGDGFAAGLVSGILNNLSLAECGKRANAEGAMATLVRGDMEGYPVLDQFLEYMGKKSHIDR
ncbi:MAG: sugar kinase [Clostridium sp.]|nr:sugar kinase [Clostridium sp.]